MSHPDQSIISRESTIVDDNTTEFKIGGNANTVLRVTLQSKSPTGRTMAYCYIDLTTNTNTQSFQMEFKKGDFL